jgi:hypothetical protein
MFYDVVRPGFEAMAQQLAPGNTWEQVRRAGSSFGESGMDGRPLLLHTMDLVTHRPHVYWHSVGADEQDETIRPGVTAMLEPTIITPDGSLGLFFDGQSIHIRPKGHGRPWLASFQVTHHPGHCYLLFYFHPECFQMSDHYACRPNFLVAQFGMLVKIPPPFDNFGFHLPGFRIKLCFQ